MCRHSGAFQRAGSRGRAMRTDEARQQVHAGCLAGGHVDAARAHLLHKSKSKALMHHGQGTAQGLSVMAWPTTTLMWQVWTSPMLPILSWKLCHARGT